MSGFQRLGVLPFDPQWNFTSILMSGFFSSTSSKNIFSIDPKKSLKIFEKVKIFEIFSRFSKKSKIYKEIACPSVAAEFCARENTKKVPEGISPKLAELVYIYLIQPHAKLFFSLSTSYESQPFPIWAIYSPLVLTGAVSRTGYWRASAESW